MLSALLLFGSRSCCPHLLNGFQDPLAQILVSFSGFSAQVVPAGRFVQHFAVGQQLEVFPDTVHHAPGAVPAVQLAGHYKGKLAETDNRLLADIFAEIDTGEIPMELTGYTEDEVESLVTALSEALHNDLNEPELSLLIVGVV